jgi:hypothetical protein
MVPVQRTRSSKNTPTSVFIQGSTLRQFAKGNPMDCNYLYLVPGTVTRMDELALPAGYPAPVSNCTPPLSPAACAVLRLKFQPEILVASRKLLPQRPCLGASIHEASLMICTPYPPKAHLVERMSTISASLSASIVVFTGGSTWMCLFCRVA